METATLNDYKNSNIVSRMFFVSAALGLLILAGDGLLIAAGRVFPDYGILSDLSRYLFWRGRGVHLQLLIFAWLSMAMMGAIYYVVPRMVKRDLFSGLAGKIHLLLQWIGIAAIGASLHLGFTEGREYLEPIMLLDVAVVIVWLFFAGNIFATIFTSKAEKVSPGLKFIGISILYLGLNFVIANFIPLNGVKDDLMIYTFAHNEVNGWFMFGLIGIMYWTLPRLFGLKENEVFTERLSTIHFWMLMFLIPPSVLHHFLYKTAPINMFWKQVGSWTSIAMLAPTAIWAYFGFKAFKLRRQPISIAGGFYLSAMIYYTLNCVQGAAQSILTANNAVHQTNWVVGHAHLALVGWISMGLFGVIYQVVPELTGRSVKSVIGLARTHLAITNAGFLGMWISLSIAGIIESIMSGSPHSEIEAVVAPYLVARLAFGALFGLGAFVFVINIHRLVFAKQAAEKVGGVYKISPTS